MKMKMNNLEEISNIIKDAIQESFPMTKIECAYTWNLRILNITIRYYCYNHDETLLYALDDEAYTMINDKHLSKLINDIGDKITEKEAEYAAERRSIRGN